MTGGMSLTFFFFKELFFSPYGSCSKEKGNLNYTARACHLVRCYSYFIRSHPLAISAIKVSWNELDKLFFFSLALSDRWYHVSVASDR